MNWLRYSGRIILALGVVAIALWATREKLIDIPVYQFWVGILCYLIAAEVVWTLAERATVRSAASSSTAGLLKFPRKLVSTTSPDWLYDGGRVRLDDIAAQNDIVRDGHEGLLASVMARQSGPLLHLLCGGAGTGRSTMLLRLGRALADHQQTVFVAMAGPDLDELPVAIAAARKAQVYLLVDDLDLRPQAEDWLYEIFSTQLPLVVVATVRESSLESPEHSGLEILQPAGLLSASVLHVPIITANDLGSLARKLSALDRQQHANLALEESSSFISVMRRLQGRKAGANLWQELDQAADLPLRQKSMIALCGAAEMGLPSRLAVQLLGEKPLARWQRSGLVKPEQGLLLPPHRNVCLSLLQTLEDEAEAPRALRQLLEATAATEPIFAIRLLFGLASTLETAPLAEAALEESTIQPTPQWPNNLQRLWRRLLQACDLPSTPSASARNADEQYPPELSRLAGLAFERQDYERALQLYRELASTPVYHAVARFNMALILSRLGRWDEATQQLHGLKDAPPGLHFLRGLIAEAAGDHLAAIEAYEHSRQADQLQLAATLRLAFCRVRTGSPRAALPMFESVLVHAPLLAEVYGGLAVAHLHAGMAQRAAAQSVRAIQAGVDPLAAHKAVARACADHYAFERAAAEYEACVNYEPADLESWRDLASVCRWLGRFRREEECLRRVQLVAPEDTENRFQMARCERDQGRAEEALELLAPLLETNATVPVLLLAAEAAGTLGDKQRQRHYASEALVLGDDSGWGQYWLAEALAEDGTEKSTAYAAAIEAFRARLTAGATPRRAARLWQAVFRAASQLGDDRLAAEAARKARQEATACAALAVEIESVTHRRSVPVDIFLEELAPAAPAHADVVTPPRTTPAPLPIAPPAPAAGTRSAARA